MRQEWDLGAEAPRVTYFKHGASLTEIEYQSELAMVAAAVNEHFAEKALGALVAQYADLPLPQAA